MNNYSPRSKLVGTRISWVGINKDDGFPFKYTASDKWNAQAHCFEPKLSKENP